MPRKLLATLLLLLLTPAALAATPGDPVHGAQLFQEKGCTQCHGANRLGTEKGPSLADVRKHLKPDAIHNQIVNGGKGMPAFGDILTEAETTDLIAWLRTRPGKVPVPPPAAKPAAPPPQPTL